MTLPKVLRFAFGTASCRSAAVTLDAGSVARACSRATALTLCLMMAWPALASDAALDDGRKRQDGADTEVVSPAFSGMSREILRMDNGVLVQGDDVHTPDGYTSGFRLTAGFSPEETPTLDVGAELRYRESDDVPSSSGGINHVQDFTSLGGSLVAGLRVGRFGIYGKTGMAQWASDPVTGRSVATPTHGTTRVQGFGARWLTSSWIGQVEFEEVNDRELEHLNMITASFHLPF
ncbi:hypothetical protein ACUN9Y_06860 [Halomonas sp. V046]|uniref:hypothetical protein n=1 Tax=Halomonas sp. V046 TaxID=3459611 RepID=UPI004043B44A